MALFIFAMLSVAGVIMLRSAVDSDEITAENLGQMAEMQRFVSLMEADLSQALPRTARDQRGDRMPAFASETGGPEAAFLRFTRGGQSNINGAIDQPATLISNIDSLTLRFRDKRGQWSDRWETGRLADLPRAIEIEFDQQGRRYRHLFLVGTGYL